MGDIITTSLFTYLSMHLIATESNANRVIGWKDQLFISFSPVLDNSDIHRSSTGYNDRFMRYLGGIGNWGHFYLLYGLWLRKLYIRE